MQINHPIKISFKDFFLKGKFDYVKLGKTKEWILQNFHEPDVINEMSNGTFIWQYSYIEFYFHSDELDMIFCDNISEIESYEKLAFDRWILDDMQSMTLSHVLSILATEQANYAVKFSDNLQNAIIKIEESNIRLWFHPADEEDKSIDPSDYYMMAFSLEL